jgi:hypothetical protein
MTAPDNKQPTSQELDDFIDSVIKPGDHATLPYYLKAQSEAKAKIQQLIIRAVVSELENLVLPPSGYVIKTDSLGKNFVYVSEKRVEDRIKELKAKE